MSVKQKSDKELIDVVSGYIVQTSGLPIEITELVHRFNKICQPIMKIEIEVRKEEVSFPELDMMVFHDEIYNGHELMKIVGIRKTEIELEGDYSGGTNNVTQKDWVPIKGAFRMRKICEEHKKPKGCQLHNLHCAYPDCEPYVDKNDYNGMLGEV